MLSLVLMLHFCAEQCEHFPKRCYFDNVWLCFIKAITFYTNNLSETMLSAIQPERCQLFVNLNMQLKKIIAMIFTGRRRLYLELCFSALSFWFYIFLLSYRSVQLLSGLVGESECIFISFSSSESVENVWGLL